MRSREDIQHIIEYVIMLVTAYPLTYATDGANNRLVDRYLKDTKQSFRFSTANTLVREKNKFLEEHPQFDFRVNDRGKFTGSVSTIENPQYDPRYKHTKQYREVA